ncbi:hypothetical protein [Sphingobacterium sp. 2149]|uniref:hypothetical protein n=1 Tax=Sphingobacterium sp. 2149 TaxID=2817763 RepID=UPI001AE6AF6C|nr:hypothetical protein [Sphingobacterium sp. 2149]MDR6734585.1 uncharacterized protein YbjT (DUF2867 family) [Sphingobacterium sp. 2149]
MKAVLIGGSGATGRALVQLMLKCDKITEIIVLLRRISFEEHTKLKQVIVDFDHLTDFEQHIQGDIAISCLGTTLKDAGSKEAQWKIDHDLNLQFAALAKKNDLPTFMLLSAVHADPESKIFYNRMKGSLEQDVKALDFNRLIIVQPGALIRPNTDRLGEKAAITALRIFNKIGLLKAYQALSVAQVANAMLQAIIHYMEGNHTLTVEEIKKLSAETIA